MLLYQLSRPLAYLWIKEKSGSKSVISYILYSSKDVSKKYEHFANQNLPIIKLKKQKDSNELGSNSSNTFGNWDGTEKQLEKIMYKEL